MGRVETEFVTNGIIRRKKTSFKVENLMVMTHK